MNRGAAAATGDILCFVHADTRPPANLVSAVRYEMAEPCTVAGAFCTRIVHNGRLLWWMTLHHFAKTFYMPAILRPRGFLQGLRCVLGALSPACTTLKACT